MDGKEEGMGELVGVELKGVSVKVDRGWLFEEVHLSITKGKLYVIEGISGSGKTTLLRIMMGLRPPTSGVIRWLVREGEEVREVSNPNEIPYRGFGYQRQTPLIVPYLTAEENISYITGIREGCEKLLNMLEVPAKTLGARLSAGEKLRVEIARVLCLKPDFLVLDEPTASLDRWRVERLRGLLRDMVSVKVYGYDKPPGIIVATHDLRIKELQASLYKGLESVRFSELTITYPR